MARRAGNLSPGNVVKCFCAVVVTVKRSVSRPTICALFSSILTICRRLLTTTEAPSLDPNGELSSPGSLICQPLEKYPAGAPVSMSSYTAVI